MGILTSPPYIGKIETLHVQMDVSFDNKLIKHTSNSGDIRDFKTVCEFRVWLSKYGKPEDGNYAGYFGDATKPNLREALRAALTQANLPIANEFQD